MLWPALASATGIHNMKAIASYTPGSLSSDEALKVFQNMAKIGTDGYLMDGTVALNHTQSQTDMMMNKALFIPNGNWMEGEMADAPRADGFEFGLRFLPTPRTPNWQKSSCASCTLRIPLSCSQKKPTASTL